MRSTLVFVLVLISLSSSARGDHGAHGKAAAHETLTHRAKGPSTTPELIERWNQPERDRWQQPARVIQALGIAPGSTVADVGAGSGYFTFELARAVGPTGRVFAVDIDEPLLGYLKDRVRLRRAANITVVRGEASHPGLAEASADLLFICDVLHHVHAFGDLTAYLRAAARTLRPGGRLAVIDYRKVESKDGPPLRHRIAKEDLVRIAREAGLAVAQDHDFLERQYFVIFRPGATYPQR